jgi:4'-phosphopantetheinyl transferase
MAGPVPLGQAAPGQIDLWYVPWDSELASGLESEYRALLPADEASGCDRFVFAAGRHQCLISRVLVRSVLSWYTGDALSVWQFATNRYGKPAIVHPAVCPLRFNLSHTTGLVVCAVSSEDEVGVDVEDCRRRPADAAIARHYFAPEEVAALEAVPEETRPLRFLEFWTLKEAFLKAHGSGLSVPLKDFSFHLPPDHPPQIRFHNPELGDTGQWQFLSLRLCQHFQGAVAVHRSIERPVTLRLIETVPLRYREIRGTLAGSGFAANNPGKGECIDKA